MSEEEKEWKNRFRELAERSYARGRYAFTDFLSLAEQQYLFAVRRETEYAGIKLWGGFEGAERQIARFGKEEICGYEDDFPVVCLRITPVNDRFVEELTHRDFLGALVNLGIDRRTIGDVVPQKGGACAQAYCLSRIAPFIVENLRRVRHTEVRCGFERNDGHCGRVKTPSEHAIDRVEAESEKGGTFFLSSLRVDCAVAAVFRLSRVDAAAYFEAERVYIDGRLCAKPFKELEAGNRVTVRGKGRFVFVGAEGESRKGRLKCRVEIDG